MLSLFALTLSHSALSLFVAVKDVKSIKQFVADYFGSSCNVNSLLSVPKGHRKVKANKIRDILIQRVSALRTQSKAAFHSALRAHGHGHGAVTMTPTADGQSAGNALNRWSGSGGTAAADTVTMSTQSGSAPVTVQSLSGRNGIASVNAVNAVNSVNAVTVDALPQIKVVPPIPPPPNRPTPPSLCGQRVNALNRGMAMGMATRCGVDRNGTAFCRRSHGAVNAVNGGNGGMALETMQRLFSSPPQHTVPDAVMPGSSGYAGCGAVKYGQIPPFGAMQSVQSMENTRFGHVDYQPFYG